MRRALAAAALAAAVLASVPQPAQAAPPPRHVAVFLVSGMTFEQFMGVPQFRALARTGGAGLMSTRMIRGDEGLGPYLTLGTGARSVVPFRSVGSSPVGGAKSGRVRVRGWPSIVDANQHRSVPGLLGSLLHSHGKVACSDPSVGLLVAADRRGDATTAPVVRAEAGGVTRCDLDVFTLVTQPPKDAGRLVARVIRHSFGRVPLRVVVLEATPSLRMLSHNDELTPIVVADGTPSTLFRHGPMHTLTSDTTRRDGVVSNEDVAPAILSAFGIPVPSDMNGATIRFQRDQGPPFDLHRRHLGERRLTVPIQVGLGIAELLVGLLCMFVIAGRVRLGDRLARYGGVLPLAMAVLGIAPLAAGGLPSVSYAWVLPFLVLVPTLTAIAAVRLRARGTLVPAAAIGTAILVFFVVEALQGWLDARTTLLGGSELDGGRFYGMGNIEVGLLMGAALWVAASLPTYEGFLLLVGAGLFAGFPDLGVNFGAAITIFAAAGLWLGLRTWRSLGLKTWLLTGVVTVVGLAAVVLANLVWSSRPTHGTHFVRHAGHRGVSALVRFAWDRLLVGWHLLLHSPFSWIPVLGLVPIIYVLRRPTPTLQSAFARYPAWRDAMLVIAVASTIAYVANDSGPAAVGWGFGLAAAGIFYIPLVEETWRTGTARAEGRHRARH